MPAKKNCTFSIADKTRVKLKSLSEYSGLSMSSVIDLLVESAEVSRPSVQWHVEGKSPVVQPPCRST